MNKAAPLLTFVVLTLFPEMHDQPVRSGRTRHSSPKRHGSILHHHFWRTIEAVEKGSTKGHFRQTKMWESIIRFYTPRSLTTRVTWAGGDDATLTNAQQKCWLQKGPKWGPGHITFNTRGQSPRCPCHLSWEAGALDSLRAFFNLVLVAAAMGSYHFTRSCPLLLWPWRTQVSRKGPILRRINTTHCIVCM